MNFKDAYKSMTDEIHGDKALLHSILNGEAQKKKRFSFSFKPVYTVALAAMFAVTVTSLYFKTGIEDHSAVSERGIKTTDTAQTNLSADKEDTQGDILASHSEHTTPKDTYSHSATADVSQPDVSQLKTSTTGAALPSDALEASPSSKPEDNADSAPEQSDWQHKNSRAIAQSDYYVAEASIEDTAGIAPASGGASSAVWSDGLTAHHGYMTIDEYWSYLGINAAAVVSLPQDLSLTLPDISQLQLSESDDALTMTAASPDGNRSAKITVAKTSDLVSRFPDETHVKINGINIAISSHNLTQTEISDIISSLAK